MICEQLIGILRIASISYDFTNLTLSLKGFKDFAQLNMISMIL